MQLIRLEQETSARAAADGEAPAGALLVADGADVLVLDVAAGAVSGGTVGGVGDRGGWESPLERAGDGGAGGGGAAEAGVRLG